MPAQAEFSPGTEPLCCTTCNTAVQEAIVGNNFALTLFTTLLPFIFIAGIVMALVYWNASTHRKFLKANHGMHFLTPVPLSTAAIILGIGLGGFIDGIVLHQLLQWHGMLSNKLPPTTLENKSVNMFWDGIFHSFTFVAVFTGVVMLWKVSNSPVALRSGNLLFGGMCMGWGLFNIVEGIIDHHILNLHNVREITGSVTLWNYGFIGFSILLVSIGLAVSRSAPRKVLLKGEGL